MKRFPGLSLNFSAPRESVEFRDPHNHAVIRENYRELTRNDSREVHTWMENHPMREVELNPQGVTNRKYGKYWTITSIFNLEENDPLRCVKTYQVKPYQDENNKDSEDTLSRHFDNEIFFQNKAYRELNNTTLTVDGITYTLRIPQIYGVKKEQYMAQFEMEYIPIKGALPKPIVSKVNSYLLSNGIFHNDPNTKNISEGYDNTIVVIDFGSADYKVSNAMGGKRTKRSRSKRKRYTKRR